MNEQTRPLTFWLCPSSSGCWCLFPPRVCVGWTEWFKMPFAFPNFPFLLNATLVLVIYALTALIYSARPGASSGRLWGLGVREGVKGVCGCPQTGQSKDDPKHGSGSADRRIPSWLSQHQQASCGSRFAPWMGRWPTAWARSPG